MCASALPASTNGDSPLVAGYPACWMRRRWGEELSASLPISPLNSVLPSLG